MCKTDVFQEPVAAAQALADLLNDLVRQGFAVAAEGFDVLIPGGTVTGVVFLTADGIWHVAENR